MGYKQLTIPKKMKEFPKGLILINGKNSYGKSTILEGVLFAFFGSKIFRGRNAASFITYGEDKAELTIYFTVDNKKYNIFRKWVELALLLRNCLNGLNHLIEKSRSLILKNFLRFQLSKH